jgi:phage gpG-like protein
MSFQIKDSISPDLLAKARALQDTRPVLEAAGLQLVALTKRAFSDPSLRAAPWRPLKPATIARKAKRGQSLEILRASGDLFQSITITKLTRNTVSVGSNKPYAAVQQLGSKKQKGRGSGIPARPFFPVTPDGQLTPLARARVEATMARKIDSLLKS